MRRCADLADCGFDNRDNDQFCRACALPLLGTALAGRYVVEALVSKGGYAAVFRGVDQHLSRRIAIKVLLPSKTTATEQEHFLREARIAAVLDHQNIAPILDYGKDGSSVFLVMPLYTAGSLRTRLATVNGPFLPTETVTNLHQLAGALYYAHTRPRPVIHRDIKPENILIHQEDRRLIITDFGIARALEPGARFGKTVTVRGTVGYMAPEQTSGVVDPRSDQFGCGVVLYEMLTGYHPFDAVGGPVRPPSIFNRELPTTLDAVVLRSLAAHPEERFADMQEFVQAFDQAARSAPGTPFRIASQSPTPESRSSSPYVRHITSPSLPIQGVNGNSADSSAHQAAVRQASSSSAYEKCLEGDQLLKQQQYSQALHAYEEALNLDPLNFHAWNGKGTALYSQGNYKKAYDAYQRATEIDAENPVVWVSAGLALNRLKRFSQSLVHFERALSIDPSYVAAWNGKGDAQLDMNMPEEAIESYEMALHYDSQSFQAWNGLGNARSILRDYSGAVEAYERALMANPRSAVAWCNKAEALMRHGHTRAALDALNEATELDRSYTRAWTLKAEVYELLGNPHEAQKARKRAKPWGLAN
jgi:serine/threonine protein kinase